jgi:hypothetical protein
MDALESAGRASRTLGTPGWTGGTGIGAVVDDVVAAVTATSSKALGALDGPFREPRCAPACSRLADAQGTCALAASFPRCLRAPGPIERPSPFQSARKADWPSRVSHFRFLKTRGVARLVQSESGNSGICSIGWDTGPLDEFSGAEIETAAEQWDGNRVGDYIRRFGKEIQPGQLKNLAMKMLHLARFRIDPDHCGFGTVVCACCPEPSC